ELITIVQQRRFNSSEKNNNNQLVNMINSELASLINHSKLITDKLDTFEKLLRSSSSNIYDKSNFSSSLHDDESIQNEELIEDERHSYHETHPTLKSKALLKALDQYSDTEDLCYLKEEIKLILSKCCISPELPDEEYQELHPQDKKQLIVTPIYWCSDESLYSKRKEKDSSMFKRVYPESEHSQYKELIGLAPDRSPFLPDWA
ncbi:8315_t:CDS:2, partial [Dentiscutata erythropus]